MQRDNWRSFRSTYATSAPRLPRACPSLPHAARLMSLAHAPMSFDYIEAVLLVDTNHYGGLVDPQQQASKPIPRGVIYSGFLQTVLSKAPFTGCVNQHSRWALPIRIYRFSFLIWLSGRF
jgi:hypothetical protein